jgi:glycosyltransferase involved in cell wall biosynthesis
MRILFLLQDFPYPPTDGMKWKTYNLLSYMAQRHECHILSYGEEILAQRAEGWTKSLPGLRVLGLFKLPKGWQLRVQQATHIFLRNPASLARWQSPALGEAICQAASRYVYDVVHYDMINMAQYQSLLTKIPGVLSTNDAMEMRYQRLALSTANPIIKMLSHYKARRMAAYEVKVLRDFAAVHVVSQIDADFLISRNPLANNVEVINLGVDSSFLETPLHQTVCDDIRGRKAIIFTAGHLPALYIAEPLLQFAREGFRQIRSVWPNVELFVLGRNASAKVARILRAEPGVRFVPWVEDYKEALEKSDIAIFLDMSGGGIKTRVIQALAVGKPVVGTPIALEGINITNGLNAFLCESLNGVTRTVVRLLQDADLRLRLGRAARELISRQYAKSVIGQEWEQLYHRAIKRELQRSRPSED